MLVLTRRPNESLIIEPFECAATDMTVAELFSSGPLVITMLEINGDQARIGVSAPKMLSIVRNELME